MTDPGCTICRGSGWDTHGDQTCRCVRRAEAAGIETDSSPDVLTAPQRLNLERDIRRMLIEARRASATHDAATLTRAVARGVMPPSVAKLAQFAKVNEEVARKIWDRIGVAQTKKETAQ